MAINFRKSAIGNYIYLNPKDYLNNKYEPSVGNFDEQSLYNNLGKVKEELKKIITYKTSFREIEAARYIEAVMNGLLGVETTVSSLNKELINMQNEFQKTLKEAITEDLNARLLAKTKDKTAGVAVGENLSIDYEKDYKEKLSQAHEKLAKAVKENDAYIQLNDLNAKKITEILKQLNNIINQELTEADVTIVQSKLSQLYKIVDRTLEQTTTSAELKGDSKTIGVTQNMKNALIDLENTLGNMQDLKLEGNIKTALGTFLIKQLRQKVRIPATYIGDVLEYAAAVAGAQALKTAESFTKEEMKEVVKSYVLGGQRSNPGLIQSYFAIDFKPNEKEELVNSPVGSALIPTMASQNKIDIAFPLPNDKLANISAKNLNIRTHTTFDIVSGTHLFNLIQTIPVITNHWINMLNTQKDMENLDFSRDMGLFIIAKGLRGDVAKFKDGSLTMESAQFLMMNDTSGTHGLIVRPISLILANIPDDSILSYTKNIRKDILDTLVSFPKIQPPSEQGMQQRISEILMKLKAITVNISLNTQDIYNTSLN
jgi:hypothetical protein